MGITDTEDRTFPTSAGVLFGVGLGGFFDGIMLHQILQWHHMVTSAGYPPDTVENLKLNTLLDGLFHAATYIFLLAGLILLWRTARRRHLRWSSKLLAGTMLIGFGAFQRGGGIGEPPITRAASRQRNGAARAVDFLGRSVLDWGAAMLIRGWALYRAGLASNPARGALKR